MSNNKQEQKQLLIDMMNDNAKDGLYENNQTAVEWLECELKKIPFIDPIKAFEQAKEMERQQQIKLLQFSKEMCSPEAPIDYIINEYNKHGK